MEADAYDLPFHDRKFDAVVCQFEIMFVPDKALAAREAYRVLKRDGVFLFNVWDALKHNKLGELAHRTITSYFKKDPPTFYQVPFSYHNRTEIRRVLKQAGFREIKTEVIAKIGKATRAKDVARGLVEGNPVAVAIAKRDPSLLRNYQRDGRCNFASLWKTKHSRTDAGNCGPGLRLRISNPVH